MKKALGLITFMISCSVSADEQVSIIYMIGDGMGPAYTSAYRYYQNGPNTDSTEKTIFDKLLVGAASTHPRGNTLVTDSAASATALATGYKTYNGAISVDHNNKPLTTVLERAKELGYNTGLVVTSQINHATPASFIAHINSRKKYNEIADQFIDSRIEGRPKIDLMFGGGLAYFKRQDRNLLAEFTELGYQYALNYEKLETLKSLPVIGLFAPQGLKHAIDSDDKVRLATMTSKALSLLHEKPFFLLVEGSQIDWCGHSNDIACALAEVHDFAEALRVASEYINQHPNTMLVATADHNTGGLSLGANGEYRWRTDVVEKIKASSTALVHSLLTNQTNLEKVWERKTDIDLSAEEFKELQATVDDWQFTQKTEATKKLIENKFRLVERFVMKIINQRSHTGWTGHGHTAVDVQIFSQGKHSSLFAGSMDNTDIARKLFTILNK